jgi:hypothetical protein
VFGTSPNPPSPYADSRRIQPIPERLRQPNGVEIGRMSGCSWRNHLITHHFWPRNTGESRRIVARFCPKFRPSRSVWNALATASLFLCGGIESAGGRSADTDTKNDLRHAFAALALTLRELEARQKKPAPNIGSTNLPVFISASTSRRDILEASAISRADTNRSKVTSEKISSTSSPRDLSASAACNSSRVFPVKVIAEKKAAGRARRGYGVLQRVPVAFPRQVTNRRRPTNLLNAHATRAIWALADEHCAKKHGPAEGNSRHGLQFRTIPAILDNQLPDVFAISLPPRARAPLRLLVKIAFHADRSVFVARFGGPTNAFTHVSHCLNNDSTLRK